MKHSFLTILLMIAVTCSSASSCTKSDDNTNTENNNKNDENMSSGKIIIKVGSKTFTATLLNNNSAKAFKGMLPLTIHMIELSGNEKYYDLPNGLPTNSSNPKTIQNGDVMLYGSKTLVLFYKTFSTSYSYTKLGSVDDVKGLKEALGSGNVAVTFELE